MKVKFLADGMLGKLAKWLRVLGYDTHYQPTIKKSTLNQLIMDGRTFLSRDAKMVAQFPGAFLLLSHHVKEQLLELKQFDLLLQKRSRWFTRCILCNEQLLKGDPNTVRDHVPDYVFFENMNRIRYCPRCNRHFWPGTHRQTMTRQLEKWGLNTGIKKEHGPLKGRITG